MNSTKIMLDLWIEARTRFTKLLDNVSEQELQKRLFPFQNSVGFLIRHVGEVELLFAKNVFGDKTVKVTAKTIIAQKDTGEWTDLPSLKAYVAESFESLKGIVEGQTNEDWETLISTNEFGTMTKAAAFGRIVSHTSYHAGQLAIVLKYGIV